MEYKNNFVLRFNSNIGESITINIPEADGTMSETEVRQAMTDLIDTGIITTSNGYPTSIRSAEIVGRALVPMFAD